jgi:Protein of unknown function (DUF3025)
MRYQAPARAEVDPSVWRQPPLDAIAALYPWIGAEHWPAIELLNELLEGRRHASTGLPLRFVEQTPALLRDGLHYEQRSFEQGAISTRANNWHDLLNALIWIGYPVLKSAINARYVAELRARTDKERSRAQMAITHFDEGGAIVFVRDAALMDYWNRHDWHGLFWCERAAWLDGRIRALVFGHATMEHALQPHQLITAKCIAVQMPDSDTPVISDDQVLTLLAERIAHAHCLNDPQELRPLPMSGIPGWHKDNGHEHFYRTADCFRPLRTGRTYPFPLFASSV